MRILAIDDDTIILDILEIYLDSIDYHDVHRATSGPLALDVLRDSDQPFECILLDISMPGMSGIELIGHIRLIEGYAYTPIIMLTGHTDKQFIAGAFSEGAWDYITKPFEMYELETRIHAAEVRNAELALLFRSAQGVPMQMAGTKSHPPKLNQSGLVSEAAFENCLLRMPSDTRRTMGVAAIEVTNFTAITRALDATRSNRYLSELAGHLTNEFAATQGIVTYLGDGLFMALSFALAERNQIGLEEASDRAMIKTDTVLFPASEQRSLCRVGHIRCQDMPYGIEPLYYLHAARCQLQVRDEVQLSA